MPTSCIDTDVVESSNVSFQLQQVTFNSIRKVLPDKAIERACRQVKYSYRKRTLTPIVTILHMILAAIWPEESFQASWQLIWGNAVGAFPWFEGKSPRSGSLAKARARLPIAVWTRVWDFLVERVQHLSESFACWRGHGTSTGRGGQRHYPLARMVTLALANTMSVVAYAVGRYDQSEQALLRPLLGKLRNGDLLVGDRHFAGANLYAEYAAAGVHFLTRVHQRLKVSRLRPLAGYAAHDFVTDLPVNQAHRRKDPTLPKTLRVRLIQTTLRIRGRRTVTWLVTSLLDTAKYPAGEILQLYGRRWRIETLFLQLKVRLSADVMRSKTHEGVLKEFAARLTALNVVRAIMLEAAVKNDQDPATLSFTHALRAILAFAPALATAPVWKLPAIYQAMLTEIAAHRIRRRNDRLEPRATRREKKHYPRLRCTRAEWRRRIAA